MGGLSWMSRMIQMRRVDWFGWVGWARWSKWVGWVGWARWVDGVNRRLARQSPRNEAKNAKVCKIDNIRYQIIQCNTMQYHKVTKYIPSNAIKNSAIHTTLYDSIWCISDQNLHFWTKKGTFWAIKVRKQPTKQLKAHILENRRHPELPGDMGKIWSHWVGSV